MVAVTRESACKKRVKMERPNEGFCSVFRSLYLVERLLFMTESVQFGFVAQFSFSVQSDEFFFP